MRHNKPVRFSRPVGLFEARSFSEDCETQNAPLKYQGFLSTDSSCATLETETVSSNMMCFNLVQLSSRVCVCFFSTATTALASQVTQRRRDKSQHSGAAGYINDQRVTHFCG